MVASTGERKYWELLLVTCQQTELTRTEQVFEEYSKLTVGLKKLSNNINLVMGNLKTVCKSVGELRESHNKMIMSVDLTSDQVNDVEEKVGQICGQLVNIERAVKRNQNDNLALKDELKMKDYERDTLEKEIKRRNIVISGVREELNECIYAKVLSILGNICPHMQQGDINCAYRLGSSGSGKTREIVVELFSKYAKDELMEGRN